MAYYLMYGDKQLFDPYTDNTVSDAKLTAKTNNPDYLDFTVPYGHECYDTIQERGALVTLKWDNTTLFFGEIETIETDFEGNKSISCVGGLDWLNSTVVRPYSTVAGEAINTAPTSVDGLFAWYIEQHNSHILDSRKSFKVGVNQGAGLDNNNYVYRSSTSYPNTWDEINDKIIDELGGYVSCTYDPLTINLYSEIYSTNNQIIDFGVNLLDYTKTVDTSSQATAVLPTGSDIYFHIRFSETATPSTSEDISDTPKTYIGTYVDSESSDITDYPMTYTWQQYSTSRGTTGDKGIAGTMSDGTTLYLHVAWAYDSAGENGFSKTDYNNRGYIGQYVDYSIEGSNDCHKYSWEEFSPVTYDSEGKEDTSGSGVHGPNSHQGPTLDISNLADIQTEYSTDFYKLGDVVYSLNGVNRYGYIEYQYSNTDCTLPKTLLTAACKALNSLISPVTTIDISAVDLALYMDNYDHLEVGQAVRIRSKFHNVDEYLMVESIELDLLDPSNTSYTLGGEYDTLTGQQNKYLKNLNSNINKSLDTVASLSDDVKETSKTAESAIEQANAAKNTAEETKGSLASAIVKYDQSIFDLQKQVDGAIETWFYGHDPGNDVEPAKDWTTDTDKNKHLGDLYYNTSTGYCYRWQNQNGVYSWSRIADTDVTKALEAAKNAQDTADHKRTIFVDTPTPPYEIGDLWVQGESGDILRCATAKAKDGAYEASDWVIASKYTDDTKAEEANKTAEEAKDTADAAKEAADKAATSIVTQYAVSTDPSVEPTSGWSQTTPEYVDGQYIWMRHIVTYGSGEVKTTNPALITGNQGAKGEPGEGIDGKTTYLHIAYANSEDGKTDFSVDDPVGKAYIGQYTDFAEDDSTDPTKYSWTKIKGEQGEKGDPGEKGDTGRGIVDTVIAYQASTDGTTAPTGTWTTDIPAVIKGQYLWTRTIVTYSDNTTSTSYSVAYQPTDGDDGTSISITSTSVMYQASTSGTTTPTGTWSNDVPVVSNGSYLWTRTVVVYSDGTTTTAYGVARMGTDGTSVTVKSTTTTYAVSTSGTVTPTSGWASTIPSVEPGSYMWSRTVVTYSDGTSTTTYTVALQGKTGASVTSLAIQYYLSTSNTTQAGGSWQDSVPEWEANHYIWQRSVTTIKMVDGTTSTQIGDPVLYSVMNSIAETVDGHTTQIQQQGEAIELRATKDEVSSAIKLASDSITSTVSETYETKADAVNTKTQVTQNADSITTLVGRADSVDTLIRESSDGIEVGKTEDGSTYEGYHTLVGTDSFQIHNVTHEEIFGMHAETISDSRTIGEIVSPSQGGVSLSSGTRDTSIAYKNVLGVNDTGAWCQLKNSTAEVDFTLHNPDASDYVADLSINLNGGTLNLGGTLGITGFPTGTHAQTMTISYENLVHLLIQSHGIATNTDHINSGTVVWTRNANTVVGYCYLNVKYYQSTWEESPVWATGLPSNTANGSNRCGFFRHDCNNGTSEIIVTSSGELKCQRRGDEITAGSNICGFFCYPTW